MLGVVMTEAPRVVGSYDDATELIPDGKLGAAALDSLGGAIAQRLPSARVRLDAQLMLRAPELAGPYVRTASDAVDDLEAGDAAPWCTGSRRDDCVRKALDETSRAVRVAPDTCEGYALSARARAARGDGAALADFDRAADTVKDRVTCLERLETMARAMGDEGRAEDALGRIVYAGCSDDSDCAKNLSWVAMQQEGLGRPNKALTLYKRAHERAPDDDALLEQVARLAAKLGMHGEAADDYDQLARRHPDQAKWKEDADGERRAAMRNVTRP